MRFLRLRAKRPKDYEREDVIRALPNYEVGEVIGRGGGSVVYSGRHRTLPWDVAVKMLIAVDREMHLRFNDEATLLAKLDHPHIVRVRDYVNSGPYLLVMERLQGGTVLDRIRRGGFTMVEACSVVLATCSALRYAHDCGVLHLDVKPENLMFSEDGVLKVADFGIARIMGGGSEGSKRAGVEFEGTDAYVAPEQVLGKELTSSTDVYSLATVLYELLSNRLPFDGVNSIARRHVDEQPLPLRAANPDVPGGIVDVVMRGLATDPGERFQTADAFAEALRKAATEAWGVDWAKMDFPKTPHPSEFRDDGTRPAPIDLDRRRRREPLLGMSRSIFGLTIVATALAVVVAALLFSRRGSFDPDRPPAEFSTPTGVALASDGTLYVAESDSARVLLVRADGTVAVLAGTGTPGFGGDGHFAIEAQLNQPAGVAVGPDGSVYIADMGNARIRRVGTDGRISTVVGGQRGSSVEDGHAPDAQLADPYGVAVGRDGSLYLSDVATHVVRQVRDGVIRRVAGTGQQGFGAEGVPARNSPLSSPRGIAVSDDGTLFIADTENHRVREVGTDGTIRTLLGTSRGGFGGDGGPASAAMAHYPSGVAVGSDRSVYVADTRNRRVRKVGPDRVVHTIGGTGESGSTENRGRATRALLVPVGVAIAHNDTVYVTDHDAGRIRLIRPQGSMDVLRSAASSRR